MKGEGRDFSGDEVLVFFVGRGEVGDGLLVLFIYLDGILEWKMRLGKVGGLGGWDWFCWFKR